MERPGELAGKEFLTDEEAAAFTQGLAYTNWDSRDGAEKSFGLDSDIKHGYNQFWIDFGTNLTDDKRTSLIVDPPDGENSLGRGAGETRWLWRCLFGTPPRWPRGPTISGALHHGVQLRPADEPERVQQQCAAPSDS